ncbi:287c2036-6aa8-45de-b308-ea07141e3ab0 [Sclerotinia trifoliorum]|uniref:287c2036-6aa8-45de-b308-ea07141e3ab0 n=1 Tax=Sclerotinia trifoliorum TaxID=28548 RepID=A0A8H2ZRA9_9HELO|nr:287c2036-6aa8-45de-b308-ea07141e3ab0 [Sclerotinia trifoliorum]
MKFMELLGIPPNARKVMQDPDFSPGDAIFLARLGFQIVTDPEGINAVNEETLVFNIGRYVFIDQRIMDRPWPAVYINMGHKGQLIKNRSQIAQRVRNWHHNKNGPPIDNWWDYKMRIVVIRKTYDHKEIPKISSIDDGMRITRLFWKKGGSGRKISVLCRRRKTRGVTFLSNRL